MKRIISGMILTLLLTSMLILAFNIQPVKASGTIFIRADGSVEGTDKIVTADKITYTFIDNIYDEIVVERDNIIIDGDGYTLQGAGSGNGIDLSSRTNVTVRNTQIKNFWYGLWLYSYSNYNSISGNNITNNSGYGIRLYSYSNYNSISGNNMTNNSYEGIQLYSSSNNSISGNNITNNSHDGILLYSYSNYNSISGNNITNNSYNGILLDSSSNYNSISGNNITNNGDDGIELYSSSNNSISGNNITNNGYDGIWLYSYSNYNSISGNNITNNGYDGILLYSYSNYNSISGNNITNNGYDGILLGYSSNNHIYHNNFINNTRQAYTEPAGYANVWDDGYPSGGNYWSDYTGVDEKSGPGQDLPGSDGIGDTPYIIDENNQDNYPLILRDVAVTNIALSKTVVGQGYSMNVNVTVANQGDFTETFNVTLYANTTAIETKQITLENNTLTTITFTWNTSGFVKGNYIISAYAWPVMGETETMDNRKEDGWVVVTIPGDANGDGVVDTKDAGMLGLAWPPQPYDPRCDFNNDGVIDTKDAGIIGLNWGKTDP